MVRRFGPAVTAWTADLPDLVGRLAVRWGLTVGEPFRGGASSVAFHADTPDGTPAVLKLSPDEAFAAEQAAVLRLFEPVSRSSATTRTGCWRGCGWRSRRWCRRSWWPVR